MQHCPLPDAWISQLIKARRLETLEEMRMTYDRDGYMDSQNNLMASPNLRYLELDGVYLSPVESLRECPNIEELVLRDTQDTNFYLDENFIQALSIAKNLKSLILDMGKYDQPFL